jgi:two-component system cell cycle response regulator CtrA
MRILILEEIGVGGNRMQSFFRGFGIMTDIVNSASEALYKLSYNSKAYDLILCNEEVHDMSCLLFITRCRQKNIAVPILLLSSVADIEMKTRALAVGADDICNQITYKEILARVYALVRRSYNHVCSEIKTGGLTLNTDNRTLSFHNINIPLTNKEYSMMELFFIRKGITISKTVFLHHLYSVTHLPINKIIDVMLCKLRQKIKKWTKGEVYFETTWGRGYTLKNKPVVNADGEILQFNNNNNNNDMSFQSTEYNNFSTNPMSAENFSDNEDYSMKNRKTPFTRDSRFNHNNFTGEKNSKEFLTKKNFDQGGDETINNKKSFIHNRENEENPTEKEFEFLKNETLSSSNVSHTDFSEISKMKKTNKLIFDNNEISTNFSGPDHSIFSK